MFSLSRDCETYQGHSWFNRFEWNRKNEKKKLLCNFVVQYLQGDSQAYRVCFMFLIERSNNKAFHFNPTLKLKNFSYIWSDSTQHLLYNFQCKHTKLRVRMTNYYAGFTTNHVHKIYTVKHLLLIYKWIVNLLYCHDIFYWIKIQLTQCTKWILLFTCISLALSNITVCMSNFAHRRHQ